MSVTAVPILPTKRSYIWFIWIGLAVAVAAAFLLSRQGDVDHTTPSGLRYRILAAGEGAHPKDGEVAVVLIETRLPDGKVLGKSQQPTPIPVKAVPIDSISKEPGVPPGLSEALKLLNKGAHYRFTIPGKLIYGDKLPAGAPIPANTPLVFDIQMVDLMSEDDYRQMMMQQQMMNGGGGPGGPGGLPGGPGHGAGGPPPPGEQLGPPSGK